MDEEEVTVNSSVPKIAPRKYPGMSPLQAGLTYGGAASTVMGPLGLIVGAGAGIVAKRMRDSWLDQEARHTRTMREEYNGMMQEADAELRIADPDEKRFINHAKRYINDGWMRLASGDESGRDMIERGNTLLQSVMSADMQARKQEEASQANFQRGLVGTAANKYREDYMANMATFEEIDKQTTRVLDLVNSEGFDPNKPFNKAVVMDLISVGVSGLYKDDPNGLESLVRAVPVIGDALGDMLKSGDYKLTPEDYNRIALEMKRSNERYASDRMGRLGEQAKALDDFARRTGSIPQDYSLSDYVSGGVKELKLTPVPQLKTSPKNPNTTAPSGRPYRYQDPVSTGARKVERWMNKRNGRPTN